MAQADAGSSPRVRGALVHEAFEIGLRGIIPARAGNTRSTGTRTTTSRDHPRVCGEHLAIPRPSFPLMGSSPRVRGTPRFGSRGHRGPGIIPTCAGNTRRASSAGPARRDHPRVCGEHKSERISKYSSLGSSPRVRGTQQRWNQPSTRKGIIPACAGNTRSGVRRRSAGRDYPRVCGEHPMASLMTGPMTGSSPRVRGTLRRSRGHERRAGIIPACAGDTMPRKARQRAWGDHPRVCGEHFCFSLWNAYDMGSPPRVRGTRPWPRP